MEILVLLFIFGVICAALASCKNRPPWAWFFAGVLLFLPVVLYLAFCKKLDEEATPNQRQCPMCKELINKYARKCKHCGEYLESRQSTGAKKIITYVDKNELKRRNFQQQVDDAVTPEEIKPSELHEDYLG